MGIPYNTTVLLLELLHAYEGTECPFSGKLSMVLNEGYMLALTENELIGVAYRLLLSV